MVDNPYTTQPPRAFWRTAVAEVSHTEISDLYRKKWDITPYDRISTAGSCFAQHIARNLVKNGYNFQDFEPPPLLLPSYRRNTLGYGLFSARYGNVYTARQLRQLLDRAFGAFHPEEAVWNSGDRFFDPFRPTIEPDGFQCADEVSALREAHFAAVRRMCAVTDVFVFTFGLTEAWVSTGDGAVYPMCPGTAAGEFDPAKYSFINFDYAAILDDMLEVVRIMRKHNRRMRFLFTVSPVPLTATASSDHVLVATTYSKSVLRAVAGTLAHQFEFVDYFPSYEIITSPPMRGMYFEPNMRNVTAAGVDHVMSHFFKAHPPAAAKPMPDDRDAEEDEDELICDEELLEEEIA